jgi:hypothetical protein
MLKIILGIFLVLHGFVHLLYLGQAARYFELQTGLLWPDGSWAFSKLLGDNPTRSLAAIFCGLAAAGFVIAAAGLFFNQPWLRTAVLAAATLSALLFLLFWNGGLQQLDSQGGLGLLLAIAILLAVLVFRWPRFDF